MKIATVGNATLPMAGRSREEVGITTIYPFGGEASPKLELRPLGRGNNFEFLESLSLKEKLCGAGAQTLATLC